MSFTLNKFNFIAFRLVAVMLIYTACRLVFYVYNQDLFPDVDGSTLMTILAGGIRFDLTAILYLNLIYFLFISVPLSRRFESSKSYKHLSNGYFIVVNLVGIAGNLMDTVYYQFTLQRTTFSVLDAFQHEQNITSIIFTAMFDFWPVTIAFFALVWTLVWTAKVSNLKTSNLRSLYYVPSHSALTVAVLALSILGMRGGLGYSTRPIAMNNAGEYVEKANQMAIVLNTPFTFLRTINKTSFPRLSYYDNEEDLAKVFTPVKKNAVESNDSQPLNVVVLIMESFSAEMSGFLNPGLNGADYKGYTPFLDSLLTKSLTFEYGFAHGRKSIDAIPAVVAGVPSMKVPFVISHYGTNELQGMGKILGQQGYHTSFFHGAPNGSMGFSAIMNLSGFEHYYGMTEFNESGLYGEEAFDGTWGIWDEEFLQYMAKTQSTLPTPFVSTFFSLSSHHPFEIPARYQGQFDAETERLSTFRYADYALQRYFETAKQQPWYDNTLFVITADHSSLAAYDSYKTDLGKFRIPILFYKPDGSLKQWVSGVAQQSDIFPTILDILNNDAEYFSFGSSLLDESTPKYAISYVNDNYQLVKGDYLLQFDGEKVTALYRYKTDTFLRNNIKDNSEVQEDKQSLVAFLQAVLQQYNNRMIDNKLTP